MSLLEISIRENIINRINNLNGTEEALWGKMNVNQMLCHVTDQLRISLGEKEASSGQSNFISRTLLKFLVVNVIQIPKNVPTSPKVDQVDGDGTRPTDFESDRKTLLAFIEKFSSTLDYFAWTPHFKFGKLTGKEWAVLAHKHLDHHLRQFGV